MQKDHNHDIKHLGQTWVYFCHIRGANGSFLSASTANTLLFSTNAASSQQMNNFMMI